MSPLDPILSMSLISLPLSRVPQQAATLTELMTVVLFPTQLWSSPSLFLSSFRSSNLQRDIGLILCRFQWHAVLSLLCFIPQITRLDGFFCAEIAFHSNKNPSTHSSLPHTLDNNVFHWVLRKFSFHSSYVDLLSYQTSRLPQLNLE